MSSKQRGWQLKQKSLGNCMNCGKKRDGESIRLCELCLSKERKEVIKIII